MRRLGLLLVLGFLPVWGLWWHEPVSQAQSGTPAPVASPSAVAYNLECRGCHGDGKKIFLGGGLFHTEPHQNYNNSRHTQKQPDGKPAASCQDCHTTNGNLASLLPKSNPGSTVNPNNLHLTCGKCHASAVTTFHDSIHGQARLRGLKGAATCADCHSAHNILPASDERSTLSHKNLPDTCAKCHADVRNDYQQSSHGLARQQGNARAPLCATCHSAVSHAKAPTSTRDFALQIPQQCSACHQKQAPSYRDTFHGQATALDYKVAATCTDCHTPHRNLPAKDPNSSVNQANLIATCSRCHQGANAGFVTYDPHAEPHNPDRSFAVYSVYTFMNWLFTGVFGFFGLHTLLWFQRSVVAALRREIAHPATQGLYVERFATPHRLTHMVMVVSFLGLASTGLPLMFYYTDWGRLLATLHGGIGTTRFLHRVCAVLTAGYALYHLSFVVRRWWAAKSLAVFTGPDSLVVRGQDLKDLVSMFRWFLYLGPQPKLDRWTYWEKFDYYAVFWGVPVIGFSGLMLWFPNFFTSFLPGWILNVAMIVHSDEALLAVGFIFAFHFFHNHLRPENFPMDTVIFTGKMSLERFKAERAAEYERLEAAGQLESILVDPPSPAARKFAQIFGYTALTIGVILVAAIFSTLLAKL